MRVIGIGSLQVKDGLTLTAPSTTKFSVSRPTAKIFREKKGFGDERSTKEGFDLKVGFSLLLFLYMNFESL